MIYNPEPKYQGWTKEMYEADPYLFMVRPMKAQVCDPNNIPKDGWIAEEKFDGIRCFMFITPSGNRIFTANIAENGWLNEISDLVPHLRDHIVPELAGTVLDGELTTPDRIFRTVQGIVVSKPEKAIDTQLKKGWAICNTFDILKYRGHNMETHPLSRRKQELELAWITIHSEFIKCVPWYIGNYFDFKSLLKQFWSEGKEGLIIKRLDAPYEQKKSKNTLKLKQIKTFDVIIMGYAPPTRERDKDSKTPLEQWLYWEDLHGRICKPDGLLAAGAFMLTPVTKPYALGYIGAIEYGVYKNGELVKIGKVRGIPDSVCTKIKKDPECFIGKVIEIKAQEIEDMATGSLRHARFNRWRPDKNPEECTFEAHLDAGGNE